jgi:SAM-dependent methyltransferase
MSLLLFMKNFRQDIQFFLKYFTCFQSDFDQKIRFYRVLKQIGEIKGNTFLDIGCGPGKLGKLIERRGGEIIYLSPDHFDLKNIDSLTKILGNGIKLPIQNNSIDFIVSTDVFEHIPEHNRAQFLHEMMRTTKKGAIFTFSQLHANNPQKNGIHLFENNFKTFNIPFPNWYEEHNQTGCPELKEITSIFPQLKMDEDISSYQGRLSIFFLILSIDMDYFLNSFTKEKFSSLKWIVERFFNCIFYYVLRIIDIPPFYSYMITIRKKINKTKETTL